MVKAECLSRRVASHSLQVKAGAECSKQVVGRDVKECALISTLPAATSVTPDVASCGDNTAGQSEPSRSTRMVCQRAMSNRPNPTQITRPVL